MSCRSRLLMTVAIAASTILGPAAAHADNDNNTLVPNNQRLNDSVVLNVYTLQHRAGCKGDVEMNVALQAAARRHTLDLLRNPGRDGDLGSDGSSPSDRAQQAGFQGTVAETVLVVSALAVNNVQILSQWYNDPAAYAIMSDCDNTEMGVWSENSLNRSVVVAVYGKPLHPREVAHEGAPGDPFRPNSGYDYDAADELEYGINWFPWILRGGYPPPAYPPS